MSTITLYNDDCMNVMKTMKDKSIDLVLCDPPYGVRIGKNGTVGGGSVRGKTQTFSNIDWDNSIPTKEYFDEMVRVSKNQIVGGGITS